MRINEIIISGNYLEFKQKEITEINNWLKKKFGSHFKCSNSKEATRLVKNISVWTRKHQDEIQMYIDSEVWQGQKMDISAFQKQVLAKELERTPLKKKIETLKKMLREMLNLFCPSQQCAEESAFEKNKLRNFIASSKLEGIYLEEY